MASPSDDTPVRSGPPAPASAEAETLSDLQLAFISLAEDSGRAAHRIDQVPAADRADVLALWSRRVASVRDRLSVLLEELGAPGAADHQQAPDEG